MIRTIGGLIAAVFMLVFVAFLIFQIITCSPLGHRLDEEKLPSCAQVSWTNKAGYNVTCDVWSCIAKLKTVTCSYPNQTLVDCESINWTGFRDE